MSLGMSLGMSSPDACLGCLSRLCDWAPWGARPDPNSGFNQGFQLGARGLGPGAGQAEAAPERVARIATQNALSRVGLSRAQSRETGAVGAFTRYSGLPRQAWARPHNSKLFTFASQLFRDKS